MTFVHFSALALIFSFGQSLPHTFPVYALPTLLPQYGLYGPIFTKTHYYVKGHIFFL